MILNDAAIRDLCLGRFWKIPGYSDGLVRADTPMISPFSEAVSGNGVVSYGLTSAGYDLRLGPKVKVFKNTWGGRIRPHYFDDPEHCRRMFDEVDGTKDGFIVVPPSPGYVLGYSLERLCIPSILKGHCVGKSTWARCGLHVNTTPLEPGWEGYLTIEISNPSPCPVDVFVGQGIAQLEFHLLTAPPEIDYRSKKGKYQNQSAEAVPARVL